MGGNLNKTKQRIASISSTKKITKAMEMVATVKLKRFKDAHEAGAEYERELTRLMGELFLHEPEQKSHYGMYNDEAKSDLYLVITSNLGLCAAYNSNIYRFLRENINNEVDVIAPIGNKGIAHLPHENRYSLTDEFAFLELSSPMEDIIKAAKLIKVIFNSKAYRSVKIVYTKYVNSLTFVPSIEQILPVQIAASEDPYESYCPPLFEPGVNALIHSLMNKYIASKLSARLVESQLSEQASRRTAMDNANDNADELIEKLTIQYNKARQGAITQEITEVVSGANAQK